MLFKKAFYFLLLNLALCSFWLSSCDTIDLYEKIVSIPGHKWNADHKPRFNFIIKDTAAPYDLFLTIRHNEKYAYNNIWVNFYTQLPGDTANKILFEARLANNKGWLGTAMDDIYDHHIRLTPAGQKFYFKKPGEYVFTLEHIMRDNPLLHIMNVGLRIEKLTP